MGLYTPLHEIAQSYVDWALSDHPRIPTGFPMFDQRTEGGAALGEVILFQCRSQVGKTTWGINVVNNNPDIATCFFSLEMHGRYILHRLAGVHTNVPTSAIYRRLKEQKETSEIRTAVQHFPHLAIIDKPALSIKEMDTALTEIETAWRRPVQLVVIDFMELIGGIPSLNDMNKVDSLARKLKDFARHRDMVVIVLHQVSRGAGSAGHEPLDITSGRFGGEVSADYVMSAYRPCLRPGISQDEYLRTNSQFFLQFLKTRGGSEIHPEGMLHHLNTESLRLSEWRNEHLQLFAPVPPAPELVRADAEALWGENVSPEYDFSEEPF